MIVLHGSSASPNIKVGDIVTDFDQTDVTNLIIQNLVEETTDKDQVGPLMERRRGGEAISVSRRPRRSSGACPSTGVWNRS